MNGRRLTGAGGWVVGLALTAFALHWAGQGSLAAPPIGDPERWAAWLDARGPVAGGFAVLRLAALGALWYVVAAGVIGAALRLIGAVALVRLADRVTIAPVRRMLAGTMTLGLAVSGVVAVAAPALRAPVFAAAQTAGSSTTSTPSPAPAAVTMHLLGPADVAPAKPLVPVPEVQAISGDRWTVRPGECFWTIAERVLTDRQGRPPTDAEIVPYWQRLIEANRNELAHRDNPDLIFPGQVFAIPSP